MSGWSYYLDFNNQAHELKEGEQTVGRSRTCDISVNDPSVSRRHVVLKADSGRILLKDLGSSNGTFINGERIKDNGELHHGDSLGLGDADLSIRIIGMSAFETVRMAAHPLEEHGEATLFLQKASADLAQEAMEMESDAGPAEPHMAPPALSPSPPAPAPEPTAPWATLPGPAAPAAPEPPAEAAVGPDPPTQPVEMQSAPGVPEGTAPTLGVGAGRLPAPAPPGPPAHARPGPPAQPTPAQQAAPEPPVPRPTPPPDLAMTPGPSPPAHQAPPTEPVLPTPAPTPGLAPPTPTPAPPNPSPPVAPTPTPAPVAPTPAPVAPTPNPPVAATPTPAPTPPVSATPTPAPATSAPATSTPAPTAPDAPIAAAPESPGDVRLDQTTGDLLPSLDGFDVTMGPEMMAAIKTEAAEQPTAATPAYNPYSAPTTQTSAAGFGIRLAASLVDAVWMAALQAGAMFAGLGLSDIVASGAASGIGLIVVLFGWAIWGTTPGKSLFKLHVSTGDSAQAGIGFPRALARIVGYFLSTATLGIGFLMIAFSKSKRGLHDLIAGTQVQRQ